jgi:PP-loop superfamily ATP-utilizing enzyme
VILLVAYAEVETTEAGEVMLHKLMACAVTRPAGKDSVILLLVASAVNGVDVLKVTVAVLSIPTPLLICSAFNSAETPPMVGVLT